MKITDTIEPALSEEEWAGQLPGRATTAGAAHGREEIEVRRRVLELTCFPLEHSLFVQNWNTMAGLAIRQDSLSTLIALANAALPDSDPQKVTREWVNAIRGVAEQGENTWRSPEGESIPNPLLTRIADALESYLPPEGT